MPAAVTLDWAARNALVVVEVDDTAATAHKSLGPGTAGLDFAGDVVDTPLPVESAYSHSSLA